MIDTGLQGGRLTEITLQRDNADMVAVFGAFTGEHCFSAIGAAIIDNNQFPRMRIVSQRFMNTSHHRCYIVLLVIHGDDEGYRVGIIVSLDGHCHSYSFF